MKKFLVASLIAVPLLTLSSAAFAEESATQEPMLLTANQMDGVTAGRPFAHELPPSFLHSLQSLITYATKSIIANQINISPVTIIQIGNNNTAIVYSGNFSTIRQ